MTLREKECARDLLDQYALPYQVLSRQRRGLGLGLEFIERGSRLWHVVAQFRPHFLAGVMGPSIATIGRLRRLLARDRTRIVVFYDTEIATLTNSFVYPLADYVITPDCYSAPVRGNHLTYPGYHELAYLHPDRFTPDREVVKALGIDTDSAYFIVRFVSYEASHDLTAEGLPLAKKLELTRMLVRHGRVLVSSERSLPKELQPYRLAVPASQIHHVLAFARLLVGESATMASESAVLGVPAVYISPLGRGYTDDQERRYGLVHNYTDGRFRSDWVEGVRKLLEHDLLAARARAARERLLSEKIDVTAWMLNFFEDAYRRHFA
jgi:uncharacterized protein